MEGTFKCVYDAMGVLFESGNPNPYHTLTTLPPKS